MSQADIRKIIGASRHLAEMDPQDEAVGRVVEYLQKQTALLAEQARGDSGWGEKSMKDDIDFINAQIRKLKSAAMIPANNYRRIIRIIDGLDKAHKLASRPQNVNIRPRIIELFRKTAGVFAEVDTVQDLNKPLEQIEKAVHALYGDQSKNETFYLGRRGKGFHEKPESD
jgi:hypothetical protein